ncbi:hypothetical protein QFC22_004372 [Naganishia vaughanmartiniae]|uniref:Uncharacterized protein n=1 Tax=Naganishia vaughanmartiniae TaxID=1424756 RepID=A0ACC2X2K8_9TREE|nr:hypothetical protein QFC22_004372 [Naganishia vaughanmartiniae]
MPLDPSHPVHHLSPRARELLSESFLVEDHMKAFAEALSISDLFDPEVTSSGLNSAAPQSPGLTAQPSISAINPNANSLGGTSKANGSSGSAGRQPLSRRSSGMTSQGWEKVEKVKALSDFAPIHQKVSKRLRSAKTWEEWRAAAVDMDAHLGFDEWKAADEDNKYDYPLVRKVKKSLRSLRESGDVKGVMGVLEICVRNNFAGTESVRMYSETLTSPLPQAYTEEVAKALDFVRTSPDISLVEKRRFYRAINKNYGASALCLSGGAGFGYYHFGVIKAFLDADLLPRVITGTSAGGLVAALTCTRTDEELREMLVPELADHITACEDSIAVWLRRLMKTGARFDAVSWARKSSYFTRGSMTFREAYERTGRALNVSVIPFDQHSPTKLLNYLTAPDCVIWSAIIASAAVPGILNGVVLMQKTAQGDLKPMNFGSKFKDGSLRVDIPLESLHLLFNVNYSIVSQVNPHVHLFFFAPRGSVGRPVEHRKGQGWRGGFLLSAAEQYLKLELTKNFRVIRDLELLPQLLGSDWSSVFLQRFAGSVTILPKSRIADWTHLLTDPDRKELKRMIQVGESVSWPKLHMIENRLKIERNVLRGRSEVRQALHRSRVTTDSDSAVRLNPIDKRLREQQRYIPLESDAEKGFVSRSKVMKRSHGSGRAPPDSGKAMTLDNNVLRRRRARTASPNLDADLSRVHRNQLEELLGHSMDSNDSSSDREVTAAHEKAETSADTHMDSLRQQRSRSFTSSFSFPSFGYRRSSQPSSPTESKKVLDRTSSSTPTSPRLTVSRLPRWLSPHPEEPSAQIDIVDDGGSEGSSEGVGEMGQEGRVIAEQDFVSQDEDDDALGTTTSEDDSMLSDGEATVTGERATRPEVRESAAEGTTF